MTPQHISAADEAETCIAELIKNAPEFTLAQVNQLRLLLGVSQGTNDLDRRADEITA